ncbi:uncharacterized protein LOC112904610 isoform X1 [Agrilus planipennis]|uniref:Uncharacterized protein LOC112904610 isoform X1 n=1 Tax=Agrilus planipennis TaxID=224129 RepID=A0A7F5QZT8_AGRPL|nr:uncharacterized protein LOC112904610 isoform X1 [Agrilus planipennis]
MGLSFNRNAGLRRSREMLVSLPLMCTVKYFSERFTTRYGPSNGGWRGFFTESRRTNTCELDLSADVGQRTMDPNGEKKMVEIVLQVNVFLIHKAFLRGWLRHPRALHNGSRGGSLVESQSNGRCVCG